MKTKTFISAAVIAAFSLAFKVIEPSSWEADKSHAKIGFTVSHLMISDVEGWFKKFDAKITASKEDFSDATAEMTADINSINTDDEKRDAHLKSPDFFDAAKFSTLSFKSISFKKIIDGTYRVGGNLTMHGVTRFVELDASCKTGINPMSKKTVAGFKITGLIKRSDFGIGASMPSTMVGDDISITVNAEFVKKELPAAGM